MKTKRTNFIPSVYHLLVACGLLLSVASAKAATEDNDLAQRISLAPVFRFSIVWVGEKLPPVVESRALWEAIETLRTKGVDKGFVAFEGFITSHPQSPWVPSLRSLLATYYRERGRYTLALDHWEAAWEATREAKEGNAKGVADYVLANWTRLLASLGRVQTLEKIFAETEGRILDRGPLQQLLNGTKEGYFKMLVKPGSSFKCGSYALNNVARVLLGTNYDARSLGEIPSPPTGFTMSELVNLSDRFKLGLVPVKLPKGAELIVPSVVHWRPNHFAAIVSKEGGLYQVVDPTFGDGAWLKAEAIREETSGYFLLPEKQLPANAVRLGPAETAMIVGRGSPNYMDDNKDITTGVKCDSSGPGHEEPCPKVGRPCPGGMPVWAISEPYISLWLHDEPLGYQPSKGPPVSFLLSYKQRDLRLNTNVFSVGTSWECSWLSYVTLQQGVTRPVTLYAPGGGVITYDNIMGATGTNYRCKGFNSSLTRLQDTNNVIHYFQQELPNGGTNIYGQIWTNLTGDLWAYLTQEIDPAGNSIRYEYGVTNNTQYLLRIVDADNQTNTVSYTNSAFPTRITAIADPYGRTSRLFYDSTGLLTNITDVVPLASSFLYDNTGVITNLHTPYGDTGFSFTQQTTTNGYIFVPLRAAEIALPNGARELYVYRDYFPEIPGSYPASVYPAKAPIFKNFSEPNEVNILMSNRNSFYWNARQYPNISAAAKTNFNNLTSNDVKIAHLKHWHHDHQVNGEGDREAGRLLCMERLPSPDGATDGQTVWYEYYSTFYAENTAVSYFEDHEQKHLPNCIARVLPDGTTNYVWIRRDVWGHPTNVVTTYTSGSDVRERTSVYVYAANGIDLLKEIFRDGANDLTLAEYSYNSGHQVLFMTNVLGEVTAYTYDSTTHLRTKTTYPSGLTTTNIYATSGPTWLLTTIDLEINRTNAFTYTNGLVYTHTDERGLTVTNTYDNLQRLLKAEDPRGYMAFQYDKLDLVSARDRLGYTNTFAYDALRRKIQEVDAAGRTSTFVWCDCGALDYTANPLNQTNRFYYINAGWLTNTTYADGSVEFLEYDLLGRVSRRRDTALNWTTNTYNNQGLVVAVSNAVGQVFKQTFDNRDRATNTVDANGVSVNVAYDNLGRVLTRTYPDSGVERFVYSARGLTAYTNQLSNATLYGYDEARRKTAETNALLEVVRYAYKPAGDLLSLTDGKSQVTAWGYDQYGRATSKTNALGTEILRFQYDANDRLTNRWSAAKNNTGYRYDAVGNLTNVVYPVSTNLALAYDALNRVTNMVDEAGACRYTYTSFGALASEDGPWASDTVSYSYTNQLRSSLSLAQPGAGSWALDYGYDGANRLKTLAAPAGTFSYDYSAGVGSAVSAAALVKKLSLPNGSYLTNTFDSVARLTGTYLKNSTNKVLNSHAYVYDPANRRTNTTRADSSYVNFGYDAIGQLKTALGYESNATARVHEQLRYVYDAAHNLSYRTNNALAQGFAVDALNQLSNAIYSGTLTVAGVTATVATNVTVNTSNATRYADNTFAKDGWTVTNGNNSFTAVAKDSAGRADTNTVSVSLPGTASFQYDLNGNLIGDGRRRLDYDDENQLMRVVVTNATSSEFVYDGKGRRRVTREWGWDAYAETWVLTNEVHYVCDGNQVIQERDWNNVVKVTYTRGTDLSGSFEGAGGIGGLLARTDASLLPGPHAYYHADGNGNVTMLVNTNQLIVAKYLYDPYGNVLAMSGPLAEANKYRFSSRAFHANSGLLSYLYRYYDPALQRWISRDLIGERDGPNTFLFGHSNPIDFVDPLGDQAWMIPIDPATPYAVKDPPGEITSLAFAAQAKYFPKIPDPYGGGYRHCVAACLLQRRNFPGIGQLCVAINDRLNEKPNSPRKAKALDSQNDMAAEQVGLKVASGPNRCEIECLNKFPSPVPPPAARPLFKLVGVKFE